MPNLALILTQYSDIWYQHRDGYLDLVVTNEDSWNSQSTNKGKDRPRLYLRRWYFRRYNVCCAFAEYLPIHSLN